MDERIQPEQEFSTSRVIIVTTLLSALSLVVVLVLNVYRAPPENYPGHEPDILIFSMNILMIIISLLVTYREYVYPAIRIFGDNVEVLASYGDHELFTKFKNYDVIRYSDVTGIARQGKRYIHFTTSNSKVHNVYLGRLSKADQGSVRNLLAMKMNLPELVI